MSPELANLFSDRPWWGVRDRLQGGAFEADQAAVVLPGPGLAVVPIVAVHVRASGPCPAIR